VTQAARDASAAALGGGDAFVQHADEMEWITTEDWAQRAAEGTDAHRVAADDFGWLERYGDWVLWSGQSSHQAEFLRVELLQRFGFSPRGILARELTRKAIEQKPASVVEGETPGQFEVSEWGVRYLVEPAGGYASGLFLDQRSNRGWVLGLRVRYALNLFAYTCSFSVCAARGGTQTWNVDASRRSLARGAENLRLNGINPGAGHRFIEEDVATYVGRMHRRGHTFDLIILDPPTFGRAAGHTFQLEHDLPGLLPACFGLLRAGGWMLVSTNLITWSEAKLRKIVTDALPINGFVWEPAGEMVPHGAVSLRLRKR
jgi:23S rRNA (cytosine1962-C5)-methyltransferase